MESDFHNFHLNLPFKLYFLESVPCFVHHSISCPLAIATFYSPQSKISLLLASNTHILSIVTNVSFPGKPFFNPSPTQLSVSVPGSLGIIQISHSVWCCNYSCTHLISPARQGCDLLILITPKGSGGALCSDGSRFNKCL